MERHEPAPRQLGTWLAAAVSAPLSAGAGAGWAAVTLAALAMLPLGKLPGRGWEKMGKGLCLVQAVWMSLMAGLLLKSSALFWPGSRSEWVVPLTLAALAVLTGPEAAPRAGAVVGLCLAVLYLPVLIGGAAQAKPEWLAAHPGKWNGLLLVGLLLPALWPLWRGDHRGQNRGILVTGAVGVLFGLLCQGILSPSVASRLEDAFYQTGRTLELGVLSRVEPVVAAASALGWYASSLFLYGGALRLGTRAGFGGWKGRIALGTVTVGAVVSGLRIPESVTVGICILLWIAMPLWTEKRNFTKNEKRC